jgi:excisionase family DNA binding protein
MGAATIMSNREKERGLALKQLFTTGEAAELCQVSQQTIIRCFDSGRIKGFRVPGSRFRRIPRDELIRFMRTNDIPSELLGTSRERVLVIESDDGVLAACTELATHDEEVEFRFTANGFDAGLAMREFQPDVLLLDPACRGLDPIALGRRLKSEPDLESTRIILITSAPRSHLVEELLALGAEGICPKPVSVDALRGALLSGVGV